MACGVEMLALSGAEWDPYPSEERRTWSGVLKIQRAICEITQENQ